MTLVEKLRFIQHMKLGDPWPQFLGGGGYTNNWGKPLSELAGEAANEIERLENLIAGMEVL